MDDDFGYFDGEDEDDMVGVVKFEQMIKNNDHLYFDADELEEIVNHYLFEGDLDHANLAAKHALLLHSNTSTAHFISAQVKFAERNLINPELRWADSFKNKDGYKHIAYKITLSKI